MERGENMGGPCDIETRFFGFGPFFFPPEFPQTKRQLFCGASEETLF